MKVARIYARVSTDAQSLERQDCLESAARAAGYYIAGIYREKASGARSDRPELLRMISDLQPGDVVIAEQIDRISRLPLEEAERLIQAIRSKGAKLSVPGIVDLSEITSGADGVAKIVLEHVQELLLKMALQIARDDYLTRRKRQKEGIELAKKSGKYRGRPPNRAQHEKIVALRQAGFSIAETAKKLSCSISQVKKVMARNKSSELIVTEIQYGK